MVQKFLEGVTTGIAGEWVTRFLTPAFAFWASGLLLWLIEDWDTRWATLDDLLGNLLFGQILVLTIGLLFLLIISSIIVQRLTLPMLRLLEGYWPGPLKHIRSWRQEKIREKIEGKEIKWEQMQERYEEGSLCFEETEEYLKLDSELYSYPNNLDLLLPTRLGNIIRASEEYPRYRYGLDVKIVWTRLWSILPENAKKEISLSRNNLDAQAQLFTWGFLSLLWCSLNWWFIFVSLAVMLTAYHGTLNPAGVYGELIRSAFDLHRFDLYAALKWPLPNNPTNERQHGEQLTRYIFRGTTPQDMFRFSHSSTNKRSNSGS